MTEYSAIAIAAHPDDIEFMMAGTLVLLHKAGWQTHYLNLASGSCGSREHGPAALRRIRRSEARKAASILGAIHHGSLADDLTIVYSVSLVRRLTAIIREVRPSIVLTHSPQDYMEDHMATSRLAVTATFARGIPNFYSRPRRRAWFGDAAIYHALPHGLCDQLRRPIAPSAFVNIAAVQKTKLEALASHESQYAWLQATQGMSSYLHEMELTARTVGRMSKRFDLAEGWQRHSHLGFASSDSDPLREALGDKYLLNNEYAPSKER